MLRTVTDRRRAGLSDGFSPSSVELAVKQLRKYAKRNNENISWPPEDVRHPIGRKKRRRKRRRRKAATRQQAPTLNSEDSNDKWWSSSDDQRWSSDS